MVKSVVNRMVVRAMATMAMRLRSLLALKLLRAILPTAFLFLTLSIAATTCDLTILDVDDPVLEDQLALLEPLHQQLWLLEGRMQISLGEQQWQLEPGDCLAMALNQTIVFANTSRKPARYLLALTALPERAAPLNVSRSIR